MSKKNKMNAIGVPNSTGPWTAVEWTGTSNSTLEGRLLTIIETLGLSEKQENALKSQIRQAIWDAYYQQPQITCAWDSTASAVLYAAMPTASQNTSTGK